MALQDSSPFSSILYRGMKARLVTHTHCCPLSSNLGPMTFLCVNYFYWHLDYGAQKPAFEKIKKKKKGKNPPQNIKLPPKEWRATSLWHKHESFSASSKGILEWSISKLLNSNVGEFWNSQDMNPWTGVFCIFQKSVPRLKVCALPNQLYLQIGSLGS